jgi:hypothetical protein
MQAGDVYVAAEATAGKVMQRLTHPPFTPATNYMPAHLIPVWCCCVFDQPAPVLLVTTAEEAVHIKVVVRAARHPQLFNTPQLQQGAPVQTAWNVSWRLFGYLWGHKEFSQHCCICRSSCRTRTCWQHSGASAAHVAQLSATSAS